MVQCVAAVMAGCTTSLITNPLDLVRARVQVTLSTSNHLSSPSQVHRLSITDTIKTLWRSERMNIFRKGLLVLKQQHSNQPDQFHTGLTARMTSSSIYSLAIIFGYESVKKMSVLPQYRPLVAW